MRPGRLAAPEARKRIAPELSAVLWDSTPERKRILPWDQSRQLLLPDLRGGGSGNHSLCPRVTGPRCDSLQAQARVEAWIPWSPRVRDTDAFRGGLVRQGLKAVIPARARRTNAQSHDPERYPARNAVECGLSWLKHGRCGGPLRPIRPARPGFSVPGERWALTEAKEPDRSGNKERRGWTKL